MLSVVCYSDNLIR